MSLTPAGALGTTNLMVRHGEVGVMMGQGGGRYRECGSNRQTRKSTRTFHGVQTTRP